MSSLFVYLCTVNDTDDILGVKFDSHFEQPLRRPDFPVAPPSSPIPRSRIRKLSPDIHIHPAGRPDFLLSPPRPQEDGFLFVPPRSSRASRRRQERLPPPPRQLPTPPGLPACPIPKITCCPWANGPSTVEDNEHEPSSDSYSFSSASSSSSSSANSDIDFEGLECARFLAEVAPYLLFPDEDKENNPNYDEQKSQDPGAPKPSAVAGSSNIVPPVPQDDGMMISGSQTEEIRHAAADRRFLEELGLTPQSFMALLDGTGIEWDEDEDEDDDDDEAGLEVVEEEDEDEAELEEELTVEEDEDEAAEAATAEEEDPSRD